MTGLSEEIQSLQPKERATGQLRSLFERRGFQRVHLNKFEEYGLYIDNLSFLESESIITFMDLDGRLLALKPDTTLSIVKNVSGKESPFYEKLYYIDEVYRLSQENREYRVVNQVGVELIGETDGFAGVEVVDLAVESLRLLGRPFVLALSHLGFVAGLLDQTGVGHGTRRRVYECLYAKNAHEAASLLREKGVADDLVGRVTALAGVGGKLRDALPRAAELAVGEAMNAAVEELRVLAGSLGDAAEQVHLDFSVVNNLDYYNGLIFQGYLEGFPRQVLSGGRYDNLMYKMGKRRGAIGFAVSLTGFNTYLKQPARSDFDLLITYQPDADYGALLAQVRELSESGLRVRVEKAGGDLSRAGFTWERQMAFVNGALKEVPTC